MMKKFLKGFKEFAVKGNVVDLAIGIVIGTAFNRIVQSFVKDVIMPPFGLVWGDKDFTITNFTGAGSGNDFINNHIDLLVFDNDLYFEFL